jgi:hypothetical protein
MTVAREAAGMGGGAERNFVFRGDSLPLPAGDGAGQRDEKGKGAE